MSNQNIRVLYISSLAVSLAVICHDRFIMAVVQKSTASLQKILRNSNFSRMMSSGQGSGRSEGKFT